MLLLPLDLTLDVVKNQVSSVFIRNLHLIEAHMGLFEKAVSAIEM